MAAGRKHTVRATAGSALTIASVLLLGGCSQGVLDPRGPIASAERIILFDSLGIMLAIVIPTIVATLGVAYWYRAGHPRGEYLPDFEYSGRIEMIVWSIPAMTVLLVGGIGWISAHELDPGKPIASAVRPLTVQVVALDWKWLFIYPEQQIASVNQLTIPAGTPINFQLTSATVMNSFFVPQLGGQIYTMSGMVTRLALLAERPGTYEGRSAQFSGDGFSDMHFNVEALPPEQFASWVDGIRRNGSMLDQQAYDELAKPSEALAPSTFGSVAGDLFADIVNLRLPAGGSQPPPHLMH